MSLFNSVSSNNTNNTTVTDAEYSASVRSSKISNSWIPTESKLSRGKKGQIQRIFTGEPLNNLCNVYTYNETTKLWYHENTIQGDPNRNGPVLYPPTSLSSNTSTIGGITYTTTNSVSTPQTGSNGYFTDSTNIDSYKAFGPVNTESWKSQTGNPIQSYPQYNNGNFGLPPGWVDGSFNGYQGIGGVSGEWIKIQLSTAIQPSNFRLQKNGIYNNEPATMTILGSNDDTNWTNLGNFTNSTAPLPALEDWIDTLTISNTYTYFAFVFTSRRTTNWTSGGVYPNYFRDPEYIEIYSLCLFTSYPSEDFGRSLDGTDNADMVAIGAPGTWFGSVSNITGYARVFTKDSSGNGWTQRGSQVSQTGGFGHSVALSQYDGNILVVGAPFYNTLTLQNGTAPAFDTGSGNYPTVDINYYNTPVSEGKVYIYKWNGSNYTLQQTLNSPSSPLSSSVIQPSWKGFYFGFSLGVTDIGDKIIIGEPSFRNIWSVIDQETTSAFHTGNAHVYDNVSVLSGGTTWTSNVSITSIIGITGINGGSRNHDFYPTKIRWGDAVGTSVDINRAGTRILAGAPANYGSLPESDDRIELAGRILTFDWDPINGVWKGMGLDDYSQHINGFKKYILQGWSTRFDGSGRRIISGCKAGVVWISVIEPSNNSGIVNVFDWNGDNWVIFPNETIEVLNYNVNSNLYVMTLHLFGESISVDGEGEMIAIGKSEHHYSIITPPSGGLRPNEFSVNNITYIGGATTTVAGSDSQVDTGGSNVWVYNIAQSMVVKGNVTVGGYIQGTGISIGANDNSDTSRKSIYFGGTKGDNKYEFSVIENRVYENLEKSELLLYKGGDGFDHDNIYNETAGEIEPGPDRIRLKSSQICFDLKPEDDRTLDNTTIKMQENSDGTATLGINLSASVLPSEALDVVGKIKSRYGFIGPGTLLTGISLDHVNLAYSPKLNNYGSASSSSYWGEAVVGPSLSYPQVSLTNSDISESEPRLVTSTYTRFALRASYNANYPVYYHYGWIYGSYRSYKVWDGVDLGDYTFFDIGHYLPNTTYYLDVAEKVPGFKGEWLEFTIPERVIVEELDFYVVDRFHLPRAFTFFGTNDGGATYNVIKETRFKQYNWGSDNSWNNMFTRTIDVNVDDPYNTFLIVIHSNSGSQDLTDASGPPLDSRMTINAIRIKAREVTYTSKLKIDNTGKIGILNTNPSHSLDVTGDINVTGGLRANGSSGTSGHVLTSSGGGAMSWTNKFWSLGTVSHPTVTMTSASSGGYVASANSNSSGSDAYYAFNNVIGAESWMDSEWSYTGSPTGTYDGNSYTTYDGSSQSWGQWIQLQVPTSITIDSIKIAPQNFRSANAPTEGKILGSTNGSTWILIHSFTGQTYTDGQYTTISFSNSVAYSYFRLSVERTGGGSGPGPGSLRIGELKFNTASTTDIYYNTGNIGIGTISPAHPLDVVGNINCTGTLSKGSGSFKIDHPLAIMSNTHNLYHSFIEGPQADLIYRGKVDLVNGGASINLDTVSKMTSGTFEALNRNVQCFTSNESDWDAVKGSVSGNILTISCQNASSTANVNWLVIGERKDKHMYDTSWTDDDGFVIPEQLK